MEFLIIIVIIAVVLKAVYAPNTNSTSYRLGRGTGKKIRKLGEWIMDDK